MIKKLRMKFVAINMSIVTIMLCVILGLVFYFTRANLETESIAMMQTLAAQPFRLSVPTEQAKEVRLPYFIVQLGPYGTVLNSDGGFFDLSNDELLSHLVGEAFLETRNLGVIKEYNLRYYKATTPIGQRLVFTDISSEVSTLNSLTRTCLLIGGFSFVLFLAVSIILSKWAIRPVEQAWTQQRQFVADASHELKTPLAVIMTNAELLNSPDYDPQKKSQFTDHILTMSRQMKGLVEQLLALARTDAAEKRCPFQRINLSTLVENAALPFEASFFERGLTLDVQTQPSIILSGAEGQLQQVVEILLDNARKYSTPGGGTWVTVQRQGKKCTVAVKNQGDPISEKDLPNLFKRFYRADKARSRDGSFGLGLSIAESIVNQHKGKIWAESKDGLNCFYVELPCQQNIS